MKHTLLKPTLAAIVLGLGLSGGAFADAKNPTICFSFQDLETQFWVAGHAAIIDTLTKSGVKVIERNANEDPNKQLQQVKDCITQKVDGIIAIPQDGASIIPVIKAANEANIPIALFNREPAKNNTAPAIVVVADNESISAETVEHMAQQAKKIGKKMTPLIMVGDLGDPNAVARKRGFDKVIAKYPDMFNKPIEVATKWDAQVALAGLKNAIQANPNVDFLFTSSDFMFPQIKSVLTQAGKWKKIGEPGHVILGGFDGDVGACGLIREKFLDATGVQDVFAESSFATNAIMKAITNGEARPNEKIFDKGFALTQENFAQKNQQMWGCVVASK